MKQPGNLICLGIDPSQVCSFVKIAIDASEGEIFDIITATVHFGNDMFNVERGKRRVILMQMTIFASVVSTLANVSSDLSTDHL
jgi:hypothetical protein